MPQGLSSKVDLPNTTEKARENTRALCHPRVMQIWSMLGVGAKAVDLILEPKLAPFDIHNHIVVNGWL